MIQRLVEALGMNNVFEEMPVELQWLLGQPMDGALILSFESKVLGAAEQLRHISSYQLLKSNGEGVGTKHQSGFAVAQLIHEENVRGAVLVASDGGGVTLMLPSCEGGPKAWRAKAERLRGDQREESSGERPMRSCAPFPQALL